MNNEQINILESEGVTETEKLLISLCKKIFSPIFVYPNPFKNDKSAKEVCDALVIFDKHIILFFDRCKIINSKLDDSIDLIEWKRWLKKSVRKQVNTANGTERWLLDRKKIYSDKTFDELISLPYDINSMVIHKVIVAHGAEEACLKESNDNCYGSLAIEYSDDEGLIDEAIPFFVTLPKNKPVHIFDSANLKSIMEYLDTPNDFINYLVAKEESLDKLNYLTYTREEELLAHYLKNLDENNQHYIGVLEKTDGFGVSQGHWKEFIESKVYESTTRANKISYIWDALISIVSEKSTHQSKSTNKIDNLVQVMLLPSRVTRRSYCEKLKHALLCFPKDKSARHLLFLRSENSEIGYMFLLLPFIEINQNLDEYIALRTWMLETASELALKRYSDLDSVVGIVLDPITPFDPSPGIGFSMLQSQDINQDVFKNAIENNIKFNFFETGFEEKMLTDEFVHEH